MSSRPQRERKAPSKLANNQARNVATAAARPKRRRAVEPNTAVPKRRKTPSNVKVNPKSKQVIINKFFIRLIGFMFEVKMCISRDFICLNQIQ